MATLKQRLHRKNSSGSYDVIYLETSADLVKRADGVKSVESSLTEIEAWDPIRYEENGTVAPFLTTIDADTLQGHPADYFAKAEDIAKGGVPSGIITMWSGASNAIPTGWLLCDGNNGTPDLRDRFVLGAGNSYAVGATGGEATHTLTVAEMPSHSHSIGRTEGSSGSNPKVNVQSFNMNSFVSGVIGSAGGGQAHNNMPPYYALCFIMKQ